MRFPFPRMETLDHVEIFRWDSVFQGWKLPTISKFSDEITFSKDGNFTTNYITVLIKYEGYTLNISKKIQICETKW
jgi:hypothetical protein